MDQVYEGFCTHSELHYPGLLHPVALVIPSGLGMDLVQSGREILGRWKTFHGIHRQHPEHRLVTLVMACRFIETFPK